MDRWSLPGPAAFIDSVVGAIRDGENVVIGSPGNAAGALTDVLQDRLARDWLLTGPLQPGAGSPIDDLYGELEIYDDRPSNRSVASLMARIESKRVIIVSSVDSQHWPDWMAFLVEYASASRNVERFDRTQLLLLTSGVPAASLPAKSPALTTLAWDGHVGEADVVSYILHAWRERGRRIDAHAKLIARIITRLALWDFELVDRLLEMNWRALFDPAKAIRDAEIDSGNWANLGPTWEQGGVAEFDGERFHHSLILARSGDPKSELSMRLWSAQASELLPALEVKRRQLAERMKASRGLPLSLQLNGELVRDLNDVEIGGLVHLARVHRLPLNIVRTAERYRGLRNKLAHLEPVNAEEALGLLSGRTDS